MLYIGIDLGTSACKLLLTDETGDIKNIVSRSYPLDFPQPGWSEQDPAAWWQAVEEGIPALLRGHDGAQVAGIGAGGQMHGLVVLDAADRVIRPAILWNDGRTADEVDYLNETVGRETLSARTANIAFAGFTAPKLLWMKKHEPELFARIDKIMLPKDYINYRLTGVHCTDPSDASGMLLYDVRHGMWSAEMLGICGVRETQMPRVFPSAAAVGTVLPEVAARLGIPETTVVAAGAGDNAAAAVGTGTVGEGACNISIGTSGTIFITSKSFGVDPHNALHSFAHADGGYHLMGVMLSAASCNTWLMERILRTRDYAAEQAEIAEDRLRGSAARSTIRTRARRSSECRSIRRAPISCRRCSRALRSGCATASRWRAALEFPLCGARSAAAGRSLRCGEKSLPMCSGSRWMFPPQRKAPGWGARCSRWSPAARTGTWRRQRRRSCVSRRPSCPILRFPHVTMCSMKSTANSIPH